MVVPGAEENRLPKHHWLGSASGSACILNCRKDAQIRMTLQLGMSARQITLTWQDYAKLVRRRSTYLLAQ